MSVPVSVNLSTYLSMNTYLYIYIHVPLHVPKTPRSGILVFQRRDVCLPGAPALACAKRANATAALKKASVAMTPR